MPLHVTLRSLLVLLVFTVHATAQADWTLAGSGWTVRPQGRYGHAMAYDSAREQLVVFGGRDAAGTRRDDTWEWKDFRWVDRQPAVHPAGRAGHAMAYDPLRQRVVLFGGLDNASGYLGDTWLWDGQTWTQYIGPGPGPRDGHVMVFDETLGVVMLWGGRSPTGYLGDHWVWNGTAWSAVTSMNAPPSPRRNMAATYDTALHRVVLFGGQTAAPAIVNETWVFDSTTSLWSQLPASAVPARWLCGLAYDPVRDVTVLSCGESNSGTTLGDTWELSGVGWTQHSGGVAPFQAVCQCYVPAVGLVLFGGITATSAPSNSTYWRDASQWRLLLIVWGNNGTTVFDSNSGQTLFVMFGGSMFGWDGTKLHLLGTLPPLGSDTCAAFDPLRGEVVTFGSAGCWTWDGSTWTHESSAGQPPLRTGGAMEFDEQRGTVVLFGGWNGSYLNDMWEWNGTGWAQVNAPTVPAGRRDHRMCRDGTGGILCFGGISQGGVLNQTWRWSNGLWSLLSPAVSPSPRFGPSMCYDALRSRVVVSGGLNVPFDTWEWDGSVWSPRLPASHPTIVSQSGFAFDSVRGVVVGMFNDAMWEYSTDAVGTAVPIGTGCTGSGGQNVLTADTGPWVETTFRATGSGFPAPCYVLSVYGLGEVAPGFPIQLALPEALPGCELFVTPDGIETLVSATGSVQSQIFLPNTPPLVGVTFYHQMLPVVLDAQFQVLEITSTNGLQLTCGAL